MGRFNGGPDLCRYILWEAEEQGLLLPYACRMGCCTACAVRIKEGEMYQPQVMPPEVCGHPAPVLEQCQAGTAAEQARHCCSALSVLEGFPICPC